MTKMIHKDAPVPVKKSQVYSTATDNQATVTIRVFQGEHKVVAKNNLLGQFDVSDIPAASRGVPQIEVAFEIDQYSILHVKVKDISS